MKVALRKYQCPVCKTIKSHETNHIGEIYAGCKKCNSTVLYCIEKEAKEQRKKLPFRKAKIHTYRFDVSKKDEREQYKKVCAFIGSETPKYDVFTPFKLSYMMKHDGKRIKLYNPNQWEHQFVSSIGRVHSWYEQIYPNKNIKSGYYLQFIV